MFLDSNTQMQTSQFYPNMQQAQPLAGYGYQPTGNYVQTPMHNYYGQPYSMPPQMMPQAQAYPQQPMQQPTQPPRRERKVIAICDPRTGNAVEIGGPSAAASKPEEKTDGPLNIRAQFANQLKLKEGEAQANLEKPAETPAPTPAPPVAAPVKPVEQTPKPAEDIPALVPVEQPKTETKQASSSAPIEPVPSPVVEAAPEAEKPVPEATIVASPPPTTEKLLDAEDTVVAPPKTPEASEDRAKSVSPLPVAPVMTSSMVEDTVEEEDETEPEKTDEERAAEEAERKRLREQELITALNDVELEEEDLINMKVYSRKFLATICDIEKELQWNQSFVKEEELKMLGVDLRSAPVRAEQPRQIRNNKGFDPNPFWLKQGTTAPQDRKPYAGRTSHDSYRGRTSAHRGKAPINRGSIERAPPVQLRKAENAWKPDKKLDGLSEREAENKVILKKVRALMNKITPTTEGELTKELISYKVSQDRELLLAVIDIFFDKAVEEPKFCPLYSQMCQRQVQHETDERKANRSDFRDAVLTRAQKTFEKADEEELEQKIKAAAEETDPKKKAELDILAQEFAAKMRRRKFGNITFIGQLYYQGLLNYKVIVMCLMKLVRPANEAANAGTEKFTPEIEEELDCCVRLMEAVGSKVEQEKVRGKAAYDAAEKRLNEDKKKYQKQTISLDQLKATEALFEKQKSWQQSLGIFDQVSGQLHEIKPRASARIRFMIMNLNELRNAKWQKRKGADEGPKTMDALHQTIKEEHQRNEADRRGYEKTRFGEDRDRGYGGGGMKKAPLPGRHSVGGGGSQQRGSQDRRLQAAKQTIGTSTQPKPALGQVSASENRGGFNRTNWGSRGAGGGGEMDRKMSRGNGPARDFGDSRKQSTADRPRQGELAPVDGGEKNPGEGQNADGRREIDSPALERSESQDSIPAVTPDQQRTLSEEETLMVRSVGTALAEINSGDGKLTEFDVEVKEAMQRNKVSLRSAVKALAAHVATKLSSSDKTAQQRDAGRALAVLLGSDDFKAQRAEGLKGLVDFAMYAAQQQLLEEYPLLWKCLAMMIFGANFWPEEPGMHIELKDFNAFFAIAADYDRLAEGDDACDKVFAVFVNVLTLLAEHILADGGEESLGTAIAMTFSEVEFVKELTEAERQKLNAALEKQVIGGNRNLLTLVSC
ncbi:unnamed protein product, partial [Mesorhabditis spiculigera]